MILKAQIRCAIHVEQNLIRLYNENVGSQDQIATSYGGLNNIIFHRDGDFSVNPIYLSKERFQEFNNHLMLIFYWKNSNSFKNSFSSDKQYEE